MLILPYKTCWKPRFPMDERPLVEGYIANFGISLDVFEFLRLDGFFRFSKKLGFLYSWYRCYYPHRLRDALSPVCGIFLVCLITKIEEDIMLSTSYGVSVFLMIYIPTPPTCLPLEGQSAPLLSHLSPLN